MFRRVVCCLLICAFVICSFGTLKAKAVALEIGVGTLVGVGIVMGVAAILIALGVSPGTTNVDFWDLVDDIVAYLPDSLKMTVIATGVGTQTLLKAWLYNDTYYFHQEVVEAVNDYLFSGVESYDETSDTVVTTAPVSTTYTSVGTGADYGSESDKVEYVLTSNNALAYLYNYHPDVYSFVKTCGYMTEFVFADDSYRFVWSTTPFTTWINEYGQTVYHYPDDHIVVHCSSSGVPSVTYNAYNAGGGYVYVMRHILTYETNKDVNLTNLAYDLSESSYSHLSVVDGGSDPDDDEDDTTRIYYPVSLKSSSEAVESMTQTTAQAGTAAEPDIAVNMTTYEVVETNGDTNYAIAGKQVGVDAETAVASILIALGISPSEDKTDFRTLVSNIIASLESDMIYNYDSYTYGSGTSLKAWKYNGSYYFSQDIMEHINSCLYNGSAVMEPIFESGGYPVDTTKYKFYEETMTYALSQTGALKEIFDACSYLAVVYQGGSGMSSPSYYYIFTDQEVYISGDAVKTKGRYVLFKTGTGLSFAKDFGLNSSTSDKTVTTLTNIGTIYVAYGDVYQAGLTPTIDIVTGFISESLSDYSFKTTPVTIDGAELTYYPVKLFSTLEETESATQTEIQTDYTTSVPNVVIDVEDGKIIEVNREPIIEVDPVPDPTTAPEVEPDPTTTPEVDPDPTTAPEVDPDPTTAPEIDPDPTTPEVDPTIAPEVDPDSEPDPTVPGIDDGSDTDAESGSSSNTDPVTSTGLKGLLEWLAVFLLSGIRSIIEWLNENLLAGFRTIIEWLNDSLLAGIRKIWELACDWLLTGIRNIFVPKEDFLTAKVDALCAKFVFAASIIETGNFIGNSLADFGTEPPVIYVDLGASRGSYDLGEKVPFIDMTWYAEYKPTVDLLLSALLWICFCWRVYVKLPGIISGTAGQFSHIVQQDDKINRE